MTSTLDDAREEISRIIYEAFPFDSAGQKPEWTPGGNSLRQDEARDAADKIIAFRAAPVPQCGKEPVAWRWKWKSQSDSHSNSHWRHSSTAPSEDVAIREPLYATPPSRFDAVTETLRQNVQSKLEQLKHYRDHGCQLDHARTIAEGRILQLEQVSHWVEMAALVSPPSEDNCDRPGACAENGRCLDLSPTASSPDVSVPARRLRE